MSLEDAKSELRRYQDIKKEAESQKTQATRDQGEIERELSRQISDAVKSAIYNQDTNIDLLRSEISKTNANYQLLHRDMNNLNDILRDTTHLQEVYDVKHRELEAEYLNKKAELDRTYKAKCAKLEEEYNAKVSAHKAALLEADADFTQKQIKRAEKKAALEKEIQEEERRLRLRKSSIAQKRKGIIIGIIICFVIAIIGGLILGNWLIQSGTFQPDAPITIGS